MEKPTAEEIMNALEKIITRVRFYGDDPVNDTQRLSLSKEMAYVTALIRGKYGLTSGFYFPAECQAAVDAKEKYGEDFLK